MKNKQSQNKSTGFSDEEKVAMKERALELRAEERMKKDRTAGEEAVLSTIAGMPEPDRVIAKKIHEIVTKSAPDLMPRTWYGMPAYANRDGKIICFLKVKSKFKSRYAEVGFNEDAKLDEGTMWPVVFALTELTAVEEKKIAELVKRAVR